MADVQDAALAAIFGYDAPEVEETETPEVAVTETPEEGKVQPSDVASSEETTSEETPAPVTETPVVKDARYEELLGELKRYRKYAPIVDMFEEKPELARRVAAKQLLGEDEPAAPAAPAVPQATEAQIREYWQGRFEADPVGALGEMVGRIVEERTAPQKRITAQSVISNYKAARRADPVFARYEAHFDAALAQADKNALMAHENPESVLDAIETMAFGVWARDQRKAAEAARARKPVVQETPRSLGEGRVASPASPARPRRQPTREEMQLADIYGEDLVKEAMDEADAESTWGRL